jgi:Rhodopirellula transposase DDE domain
VQQSELLFKTAMGNEVQTIRQKYRTVAPVLNERGRRTWAAAEARALGRGGITLVAEATGLNRNTIQAGLQETQAPKSRRRYQPEILRSRADGGGRKSLAESDPELLPTLKSLVEPATRGDPMSPLRWTCLSLSQLSVALGQLGHRASTQTIARTLHELGYSLQSNRKSKEGSSHPDRDQQFQYISDQVKAFQSSGQPVISVDTKKKELIGEFKNGGREWRPQGDPTLVNSHDFPTKEKKRKGQDKQPTNKAIPYGIYDLTSNAGWVSVGIDHDTPEFAVQSIRTWWIRMGRSAYPEAKQLLITADCGGSNSYRARLWKTALQRLATETGIRISVCHFPPGTSKWNKIEHRMFCHITHNWRGRPLVSLETVVNLIGHTTTGAGLKIKAKLDHGAYPKGVKVSDAEMETLQIERADFHGDWNYAILPVSEKHRKRRFTST